MERQSRPPSRVRLKLSATIFDGPRLCRRPAAAAAVRPALLIASDPADHRSVVHGSAVPVTQICNLLYRRIVFCGRSTTRRSLLFATHRRLQIGDTAQITNPFHNPHLGVISYSEPNAGGRWLHIVVPDRDGFKPQRGGLFIATNINKLFFLFFGGVALATTCPPSCQRPTMPGGWQCSPRRAAEKQKERERFSFWLRASRRLRPARQRASPPDSLPLSARVSGRTGHKFQTGHCP
jgi:hypothetical protein